MASVPAGSGTPADAFPWNQARPRVGDGGMATRYVGQLRNKQALLTDKEPQISEAIWSRRRVSSGRQKEDSKRPRFWSGWVPPGLTVDELVKHRRRRPPTSSRPQDNIRLLDGSFAQIKSEYKRRFRRNSGFLKALEKLRPCDLLFLEGELFHKPEYAEEFKEHPYSKSTLLRRPSNLKPEGELLTVTENQDKFKFIPVGKSRSARRPTFLKPEGNFLVSISEVHEKFIEFAGVKRPELIRKATSLKLEGEHEILSEVAEKFICHPPQGPVEKIRRPENLVIDTSEVMNNITETTQQFVDYGHQEKRGKKVPLSDLTPEGQREFHPEYNEQYIDHGHQSRREITRPTNELVSEGQREFQPEYKDRFIDHGRQDRRGVTVPPSDLVPEGQREFHPEYKEQFVAFPIQRQSVKKPEGNLKSEGTIEAITEIRSEYKDFPRSRPVLQRNNSQLKPEGEMEKSTEIKSEYIDFHPQRPVLHRKNSLLKPEGEMEKVTEKSEEFRDFHPPRPIIYRPHSNLKPSGEIAKTTEKRDEFKNYQPKRPVIQRVNSMLRPEGEMEQVTEKRAEYKDFHPSRPVIYRKNSTLKPEGQMLQVTEKKAEFKDFHPSRPILYRKNSMLKPEGDMERTTEKGAEFKDFRPSRPIIRRISDNLRPEGDLLEKSSELHAEYRDFHPSRPILYRKPSNLRPEGDLEKSTELKSQYRDYNPMRPVIYTEGTNLKPGHRIEERKRALSAKKSDYLRLEGEIEIRPMPRHSVMREDDNVRTAPAGPRPGLVTSLDDTELYGSSFQVLADGRRSVTFAPVYKRLSVTSHGDRAVSKLPKVEGSSGSETLPRSRARRTLLTSDTTSTNTSIDGSSICDKHQSYLRAEHSDPRSHSPSSKDKSFVVLQDDNNNDYAEREGKEPTPNRWLRGSLRDRNEPWSPSWALNPNTKEVPTI